MSLTTESLRRLWMACANEPARPHYVFVTPLQFEDLNRRYTWQTENPTHDAWDGYNWHHGMEDQVRAKGLAQRRKRRAFLRSRRNQRAL